MQFGKLTGEDLRLFLQLVGVFQLHEQEFIGDVRANPEELLRTDALSVYWCNYYEKPFIEHLGACVGALGFSDIISEISASPKPVQAMVEFIGGADAEIEAAFSQLEGDEPKALQRGLPVTMALVYSLAMSMHCLRVYGYYLNDLVARVREKRDRDALYAAVKIDPTTMGCPSVVAEIGRARLAGDKLFFTRLRNSIEGKFTKREQANFQKMRVIFQVLKETGAERLSDSQLYELFVNQLGLYSSDKVRGDVRKNLRKLASEYLTKGATT